MLGSWLIGWPVGCEWQHVQLNLYSPPTPAIALHALLSLLNISFAFVIVEWHLEWEEGGVWKSKLQISCKEEERTANEKRPEIEQVLILIVCLLNLHPMYMYFCLPDLAEHLQGREGHLGNFLTTRTFLYFINNNNLLEK